MLQHRGQFFPWWTAPSERPHFVSVHRGGVAETGNVSQLEPTGSQLGSRELRANLLQGLEGNIPPGVAERVEECGATGPRWARRLLARWPAAGQASAVFGNTACPFGLRVRNELTVLLTFSALTYSWSLCLCSFYVVWPGWFFSFLFFVFLFPVLLYFNLLNSIALNVIS